METSAISYRVADFLKQHPPFHVMDDADLLALAAHGRVRFFEANEFILWQGEPHKSHVFVIQQGTVSLWDEADGQAALRDVRGAGDMLGVERFADAPFCLHSARSASDVVIYSFPAADFEELVLKYPYARQFVEAHDTVTADYQWAGDSRDLQQVFLHDVVARKSLPSCSSQATIRDVARLMQAAASDALAIVDAENRLQGMVTVDSVLAWVAEGAGSAEQPAAILQQHTLPAVGEGASVIDGVLTIAEADTTAVAVTADAAGGSKIHALVTARDIGRVFGDQPISILSEIRRAATAAELGDLNRRVRAFALQYLGTVTSAGWVARFVFLADVAIVRRVITLAGEESETACWCFCGAAGRGEAVTRHVPELVLIGESESERAKWQQAYERVSDLLEACDYMPRATPFDRAFHAANKAEWQSRYRNWLQDPIRSEMSRARPFFDLRPVHGPASLWRELEETVAAAIDRDILYVVANDCLASLPPLTFFHDAVVEESGEQTATFRLEHSALQPLVDVGRVFGMAVKKVLGTSTGERFALARTLMPEHESVFREASETLRILLWQQARIGISQGTTGSELPPSLLSRHDRHVLKSGFRSILRLVEFTGNSPWFATV